jgi:hypothetical protein
MAKVRYCSIELDKKYPCIVGWGIVGKDFHKSCFDEPQEQNCRNLVDGPDDVDSKSDLDICACGDYRRDHEGGVGKCRKPNDLCHGFQPCVSFRKVMNGS